MSNESKGRQEETLASRKKEGGEGEGESKETKV